MSRDVSLSQYSAEAAQTESLALTDGNSSLDREQLAKQIRERLSVNGWTLIATVTTCVLFLSWNYLPVYHTDIWGHVSYGSWILEHRTLPVEDPFVDLAAGVELIDNAWLSQVLFSLTVESFGPAGLNDLYAVMLLGIFLAFAGTYSIRGEQKMVGFLCAGAACLITAPRLAILRPELSGMLCFALVLLQLAFIDRQRRTANSANSGVPRICWLTLPLTFIVWANMHGSYIVGLGVLGCAALGTGVECLFQSGSLSHCFRSARVRSDLLLLQFSILAVCINPYGVDLLLQTLLFPTHPNLKSVMEWYPLKMLSLEGIPMMASWLVAAFAIRHSRKSFSVRDVLMLTGLTLAVCLRVRMIAWYAPVYVFVMAPHFADCVARIASLQWTRRISGALGILERPSFHIGLITAFVVYLSFAFSPISRHVMGGTTRPLEQALSHQTPLGVSEYFETHPPRGLIYAPQWWGDWLVWKSNNSIDVFASTNSIHLTPANTWNDYLSISRGRNGFENLLTRYRINTVVVSQDLQPGLVKIMDRTAGWRAVHRDDISVIYERNRMTASVSPEPVAH